MTERLLDVAVGEVGEQKRRAKLEDDQEGARQRNVDVRTGQHQDRPVPEVEAVAPKTEPDERRVAEDAAEASGRVREGGDERAREEREQQEAALVEARLEVVDDEEVAQDQRQRHHSDRIEQPAGAPAPRAKVVRMPYERQ